MPTYEDLMKDAKNEEIEKFFKDLRISFTYCGVLSPEPDLKTKKKLLKVMKEKLAEMNLDE